MRRGWFKRAFFGYVSWGAMISHERAATGYRWRVRRR